MTYFHPDSNNKKNSIQLRIIVGVLLPVIAAGAALLLWVYNPVTAGDRPIRLFCLLYEVTGIYCPGCGMMRGIYELLHFNFLQALRDNALIILVITPLTGYFLLREYVHFVFNGKYRMPAPRFRKWMIILFITLIVVFTVLRNLPFDIFNNLRPSV